MLKAELKVVGGKQHGSLIPLQTRKFLVGREQDCQLRPASDSVSRHHCVFTVDDFSVRLRDLGSTNGTFVNGQRVQGQAILQPGDRILIGKLEFEIVIHGKVAPITHARVDVPVGSSSDAGFLLSDLAEMPESMPADATMTDLPVPSLGASAESVATSDTAVMSTDNTSLIPPATPTTPTTRPEPPNSDEKLPAAVVDSATQTQSIPGSVPNLAVPPTPVPSAPLMPPPFGVPGAIPGAYPQPTYLQAPFASYAPQYMPSPYGIQQPFMPQPGYMDPTYQQQLAYQQHLAQQSMLAQYAAAAPTAAATETTEVESKTKSINIPAVNLPPPEETGAKPPEPPPPPRTEGTTATVAAEVPNRQLAADILNKLKNRR